ncbi:GFA family protein [Ahrensia kielensis]|uniref:GFA family protein n=1 Tax=Ahrensia kielensis TaxID=76980 RepID=A0ABU9T6D9_9HYPH
MAKGSCHCGAVSFDVSGELRKVIYCHCEQCRKQTGHFVAATSAADKDIDIHGGDNLTWYAASETAKRGFCSHCGSVLFWKSNGSDKTSIMAGSLEKPTGLVADRHIYVADKGDYYEICDGLPVFAQSDLI